MHVFTITYCVSYSNHLTIQYTLSYYLASYGKKSCIALYIFYYDLIMYYKIKCSMLPHFLIYSSYQLSYLKLTSTRNVTTNHGSLREKKVEPICTL